MNAATSAFGQTPQADFSRKSFLIVDDFQGMRTILRDILRSCGADVKRIATASNGKEAIDLLSGTSFDVVLCDFNLGSGKNGQQVLEEAKFRQLAGPACAWIMITAEKTSDAVTGAAEYQPDAYLLKPITEATMRSRLTKIWARKEAFSEIDRAMRRHDHAKAIRLCDERLAFDKTNAAELLRTKAELALASGDYSLARQVYEVVLAERDIPWAKAGLAKIHIQNNELPQAKDVLEDVLLETPAYLEAHDLLASVLRNMGALEAAAQSLERAARLSPNSVVRQKNLGDIALRLGQLDSAERAFRKSLTLGEHSILKTPDAYLGLAKTCGAKADPLEALRVLGNLGKAFDNETVKLQALAVEGVVHHQSGNADRARQIAVELDARMKGAASVLDNQSSLEVARLFFATGEKDRAVAVLQEQVKNSPDNASLIEEVKGIFADAQMAEQGAALVEVSRQEGMELMNRGVLMARDGRYEEAIEAMRNASLSMASNPRVLFNLAHVIITRIQRLGVTPELAEEARNSLQAANQLAPGQPRFAQLTALLEASLSAR